MMKKGEKWEAGKNAKMQKKYIKIIEKTATNKKINLNQYNNIKPTPALGAIDGQLRISWLRPLQHFLMMQNN